MVASPTDATARAEARVDDRASAAVASSACLAAVADDRTDAVAERARCFGTIVTCCATRPAGLWARASQLAP